MAISAKEYYIPETDINIDLAGNWYVLDRNNIKDNEILNKIGLNQEEIINKFESNNLYMHAFSIIDKSDYDEIFIRISDSNKINNLNNYCNCYVRRLAKKYAKNYNKKDFRLILNDYKYFSIRSKYQNYDLLEYYTFVNAKKIIITFKSTRTLVEKECDDIVKNIKFNIKDEFKRENSKFYLYRDGIIGIIIGLIVGTIVSIKRVKSIKKRRKKSIKNNKKK